MKQGSAALAAMKVVASLRSGFAFVALLIVAVSALPERAGAVQTVDLHRLRWFVHVDLIDPDSGRDLVFWQKAIDRAMALANEALEGRNGPADRACCSRLDRPAAVATFGAAGDGRDVLDSLAEQNFFNTSGPAGSNAYLIDSISYCGGSAPGTIGCAERPSCNGNGGDNPDLWMVVTVDAFDGGILAPVVAHERGHNACLQHVATDECQIMQATVFSPGLASCLSAGECTNYRAGRTTTSSGQQCTCHPAAGGIEPEGTLCASNPLGLCSGGLCDVTLEGAAVRPVAAAAPGTAAGGPPDDALAMSAATGHWSTLGQFSPTGDDVRGLEYAHDSGLLFGIVPTIADDRLVTLDPATGAITGTVATYANGTEEFVSLAYDPGDTSAPSDDRLLVLEVAIGGIGELRAINPAAPSIASFVGSITISPADLVSGLAYDSIHDRLYLATPFGPDGLYRMDLASCTPSPCAMAQVSGARLFRDDASLAFSPRTGKLYLVGTQFGGERTFYDVVDPETGRSEKTLSLDAFTPAGLAAVPEPFGAISLLAGVLGVIVAYRARHGCSSMAGVTCVAVTRSRGAEETKMRLRGWKSMGGVALGLALAALVGCGQGDQGGTQSAADAVEAAADDVAAGVEGAADAVSDSAAQLGAEAQDAAAAAGDAVEAAGDSAAAAVDGAAAAVDGAAAAAGDAVDSAAAAADSAVDSAAAAVDQAGAAAADAGAAAAGAAAGALDAAAQEADAAKKALEQSAQ